MSDMSSKKVLLIDEYKEPLKLVESYDTPSKEHSGAVLATLYGTLSDFSEETRNNRWYSGSLWRKVLNDPLFKEALETKSSYGEADHPLDIENRLETHIPYVSHIVREPRINEAKQCVEGYIDVLDTPHGRIVKTLIDYGTTIGVSSRGSGDLTTIDGKVMVDENTYTFITWDIVARPSNRKARVHEIDTVNASGQTASESLKSQVNTMIKNHDVISLKITESLVRNTNIPDKDNFIKLIHESIENQSSTSDADNREDLVPKSDLDDAYRRILDLKKENSELSTENDDLKQSLTESENTISDLNGLNKNLSSMVASYMEQLSDDKDDNHSEHTMKNESESDGDKKYNEVETEDEIDFSEVLEALDDSNSKIMKKLSEVSKKLNQSYTISDLEKDKSDLNNEISKLRKDNAELKESLKIANAERTEMVRKASSITNEYFKLRCSQLGLNEQVVRKEFNNRLYEYDLQDINDVLRECYTASTKSSSSRLINESNNSTNSIGSLQLTGSIKSKSMSTSTDSDDIDLDLVESIRQTKLG